MSSIEDLNIKRLELTDKLDDIRKERMVLVREFRLLRDTERDTKYTILKIHERTLEMIREEEENERDKAQI